MGSSSSTVDAPDAGRRPTRRGIEARGALVAAAERLFAEHGIAGVSLRDVSAAAGQRNHSAAQYHFGDREGLVAAVYEAHMHRVDARRQGLLDALLASPRPGDVAGLVEVAVVPVAEEVIASEGWYGRFLLRTRWDPIATEVVARLDTTTALREAGRRLAAALEHLPPKVRRARLDQFFSLVVSTLASWEWSHDRGEDPLAVDLLITDLIATGTALLLAPTT